MCFQSMAVLLRTGFTMVTSFFMQHIHIILLFLSQQQNVIQFVAVSFLLPRSSRQAGMIRYITLMTGYPVQRLANPMRFQWRVILYMKYTKQRKKSMPQSALVSMGWYNTLKRGTIGVNTEWQLVIVSEKLYTEQCKFLTREGYNTFMVLIT